MANTTITDIKTNAAVNDKKIYREQVKAKIDQIDARIDEFKAKMAQTEAEGRMQYNNVLQDLNQKRDAAKAKFDELQNASESAWDDVQQGFQNAWEELDQSLQRALRNF
jgi:hypothetical protein